MSDKQKYYLWAVIKYVLMFAVPLIAAGIIWGVIKEPANNTVVGRFALGAFIIGLLALMFASDFIKAQIEQLKLDKRVAFIKNHAALFLGFALVLYVATLIAEDAIDFCLIAGISHALAWIAEKIEKKYYRLYKPVISNG
jgi:hypothetical protein